MFCSDLCLHAYLNKIYCNCFQCNNQIEKGGSSIFDDNWFCNDECIQKYMKENIDNQQNEELLQDNTPDDNTLEDNTLEDNIVYDPMIDF